MFRTTKPWSMGLLILGGWVWIGAAVAEDEAVQRDRDRLRAAADLLSQAYVFVQSASGVVIEASGLVLTNYHVIEEERAARLRFANGREVASHTLGLDPVGDLALLAIDDPGPFPSVPLAPAEALQPGAPVMAIGNPFALGSKDDTPTVSLGVLGSGRVVRGDYTDCVVLDAAVNPGNSGGPAFDLRGRLLGINGQIRTRTGFKVNSGIGLAITCCQIRDFLPALRAAEGGYVHHSSIPPGLELTDGDSGVVVKAWKNAPRPDLLQPGERILTVAGRPATSAATAVGLFGSLPYTRDLTIPVEVSSSQAMRSVQVPVVRRRIPGQPWMGLDTKAQRVPRPAAEGGIQAADRLVITRVAESGPAAAIGLKIGQSVLAIDRTPMTTPIDLLRILVAREIGDRLALRIEDPDGKVREAVLILRPRP